MKTLIVCTNRYTNPAPVMPFGACLVADAVERGGYECQLLDLMFQQHPEEALVSALQRQKPDVVGLSVRNIDNNEMDAPLAFHGELPDLVRAIRRRTNVPIVLGGAAVGVMPEALLRFSGASCAVLGDGEVIFPQLLSGLERGQPLESAPGVGWIQDGAFIQGEDPPANSLGACAVPDYSRWINLRSYGSHMATAPIQTKRGCPYRCIYCTYQALEGRGYRLCSPESVVDAVLKLTSQGLRDVEFVDNVFNSPYEHAMAVCEGLARKWHGARLQSLELNPLFLDDELVVAMELAGFSGIGITVESAAAGVLEKLRKGFHTDHVYRAAETLRKHSLPCLWIFLFGCPGETPETVQETLRFIHQAVRPQDVAFFNVGVRIYPGTELESIARAEGVLASSAQEMLTPVFYVSPQVDRLWLSKTLRTFMNTHLNCLDSKSLSFPFLPAIHRAGRMLGVRPPLWRYTRRIRRLLRTFWPEL